MKIVSNYTQERRLMVPYIAVKLYENVMPMILKCLSDVLAAHIAGREYSRYRNESRININQYYKK